MCKPKTTRHDKSKALIVALLRSLVFAGAVTIIIWGGLMLLCGWPIWQWLAILLDKYCLLDKGNSSLEQDSGPEQLVQFKAAQIGDERHTSGQKNISDIIMHTFNTNYENVTEIMNKTFNNRYMSNSPMGMQKMVSGAIGSLNGYLTIQFCDTVDKSVELVLCVIFLFSGSVAFLVLFISFFVRFTKEDYKKILSKNKTIVANAIPLERVVAEEDYPALIDTLHSCDHTHTIDPQSQLFLYITKLVNETWIYEERLGKDAKSLSHNKLKVTGVFQIDNKTLWDVYNHELDSAHTSKPPDEIQSKPIRTTTIETSFSSPSTVKSDKDIDTTQEVAAEQQNLLDKGAAAAERSANGDNFQEKLRQNEMYLFHGTRLENIKGIIDNGFNLGRARMGLYGKAIYLAESSEKADQYSDNSNKRRKTQLAMLVVRVIQGRMHCHTKEGVVHMPYCGLIGARKPKYHTVVAGVNKRFREFLVYDAKLCYPEFVVLYDRE